MELVTKNFESSISRRLLETQLDSENPQRFEEALSDAFTLLGFSTTHIGGPNEPDVIIKDEPITFIIEAKTSKDGLIGENHINFDALDRYKERYNSDYIGVVAGEFRSGNLLTTAKKHNIRLIETTALCQIIEFHLMRSYSTTELRNLIFETETEKLTPDVVQEFLLPESDLVRGSIWILGHLLQLKDINQEITENELNILYKFHGANTSWLEIAESLEFLANPPIAVLNKINSSYSLNGDLDEIFEKVGVLQSAINEIKIGGSQASTYQSKLRPSFPSDEKNIEPKGARVTAGQFKHIGDGLFEWKRNPNVKLDLKGSIGDLRKQMDQYGISTKNINGFQWVLRNQADLIRRL